MRIQHNKQSKNVIHIRSCFVVYFVCIRLFCYLCCVTGNASTHQVLHSRDPYKQIHCVRGYNYAHPVD